MVEFLGAAVLDGIDEEGNEAQFDDANVIYGRKVRMKGKKLRRCRSPSISRCSTCSQRRKE